MHLERSGVYLICNVRQKAKRYSEINSATICWDNAIFCLWFFGNGDSVQTQNSLYTVFPAGLADASFLN
jgi:hypothetical protein